MYTTGSSAFILSAFAAQATYAEPTVESRATTSSCPSIWTTVASDLYSTFGGCTDAARQAIRASFHDCFPGSCDGSLILSDECTSRGADNTQITSICTTLSDKVSTYNVSAADIIQLGTAIGIAACSGPSITFQVGRVDNSTANAAGQLPGPASSAADQIDAFVAKGFTADELIALIGAHTIGKNLSGNALDTTDSKWDNTFYSDVSSGKAPATLTSDQNLADSNQTTDAWTEYADSESQWEADFAAAMKKMSLMGVADESTLTDCSSVVSAAVSNTTNSDTDTNSKSTTKSGGSTVRRSVGMSGWATSAMVALIMLL